MTPTSFTSILFGRSTAMKWMHFNAAELYRKRNQLISNMTIGTSALASAAGVASLYFDTRSVFLAAVGANIALTVISTASRYLQYSEKCEKHTGVVNSLGNITRKISRELAFMEGSKELSRDRLETIAKAYDGIIQNSPVIPNPIIKQFKVQFSTIDERHLPDIVLMSKDSLEKL